MAMTSSRSAGSVFLICVFCSSQLFAQSPDTEKTGERIQLENQTSRRNPRFVFLKIPHVRQKKKLCATASASMALSHYGLKMDQVAIKQLAVSVTKNPQFAGTYYVDLVNGLAKKGIHWKRNPHPTTAKGFQAGLKTIRESLLNGRPVIIDTNLAPNGHTMLVNGIDLQRRVITVIDPNRPPPGRRVYTYDQFEKIWRSKTVDVRGSILTFPPEKQRGNNDASKSN